MSTMDVKKEVRQRYGAIAASSGASCCGPTGCGTDASLEQQRSENLGYSSDDLGALPEGANLGLGCGNPTALAGLKEGEVVVDLGSGGGIDCFLASKQVGDAGRVIGVDMTPEMLVKARENAEKGGYTNVEFREGEIEHLPIEDNTVDVVISNCVINLSPDKPQVFREIFRVLKPGGRIHVSDIVLEKALPDSIVNSAAAVAACIGGASLKEEYLGAIADAGMVAVEVQAETRFSLSAFDDDPIVQGAMNAVSEVPREDIEQAGDSVVSIKVQAYKPAVSCC